jgi:transcriptional regulator with XRE-family HTH domain
MLKPRITLTDELLHYIYEERTSRGINASNLSKAIGKQPAFISQMENKRIGSISTDLLLKIFQELHNDLTDDEIIEKIQAILNSVKDEVIKKNGYALVNENPSSTGKTKSFTLYLNHYSFDDIIKELANQLKILYDADTTIIAQILNSFIISVREVPDVAMFLSSLPLNIIKPLDQNERSNLTIELSNVFSKYCDMAVAKAGFKDEIN